MKTNKVKKYLNAHVGRIAGVTAALIGGGLDVAANGLRVSNVTGTVVGAFSGYVVGDLNDKVHAITGHQSTSMIASAAVMGFSITVNSTRSARGLDDATKVEEPAVDAWSALTDGMSEDEILSIIAGK